VASPLTDPGDEGDEGQHQARVIEEGHGAILAGGAKEGGSQAKPGGREPGQGRLKERGGEVECQEVGEQAEAESQKQVEGGLQEQGQADGQGGEDQDQGEGRHEGAKEDQAQEPGGRRQERHDLDYRPTAGWRGGCEAQARVSWA